MFKDIPNYGKRGRNDYECKVLVRAFSQYCKLCGKHGDIGTYIDEVDRLSYIFSQRAVKYYYPKYRIIKEHKP